MSGICKAVWKFVSKWQPCNKFRLPLEVSKIRGVAKGSNFWKCVSNKRTIKVCVSCSWQCPGTSASSAAHLTVSLFLCSSGINAQWKSRALEGRCVSSKKPFKGQRQRQGSCWEERKRKVIPQRGVIDFANQWFFTCLAHLIFDCLRPPPLSKMACRWNCWPPLKRRKWSKTLC